MTKSGHYGAILSLQFNSNGFILILMLGTKLISSSEDDTVIEWCAITMVVE